MPNATITKENGALYKVRPIENFRELYESSAELFPHEPAFMLKNKKGKYDYVTYVQYRDDIRAFGTALWSMGLKNQKIAVMGNNSYAWGVTYLAVASALGVIVPIDKELLFDDINNILTVSQCKLLVLDKKAYNKIKDRAEELPEGLQLMLMSDLTNEAVDYTFEAVLNTGKELMAKNDKAYQEYLTVKIDRDALAVIIFTSGTSGLAKGVMLSQYNICFVVMSNSSVANIGPGDRMLSILPIHHTFECSLGFLAPIYNGCCIAFCESLLKLSKNMQEVQPTVLFTVPLVLEKFHDRILKAVSEKKGGKLKFAVGKALANATERIGISLSDRLFEEITKNFGGHLRLCIVGAAAISPDVVKDFKTFGIDTYVGYGLTECAPLVTCNHDGLFTTNTVGDPIPGVEIKIVNQGADGIGEVCIKGPNVMLGYYLNEEATKEVIDEEGWFHSGDLGYIDENGHLRLTGRAKNVIVTKNGKNVYPEEIEYYLLKNPYIAEAMVVGDENPEKGTVVAAKIFPDLNAIREATKKENMSSDEIAKFFEKIVADINKMLPNYKNIFEFDIRDSEFVKTTTSKIKRYMYTEKKNENAKPAENADAPKDENGEN